MNIYAYTSQLKKKNKYIGTRLNILRFGNNMGIKVFSLNTHDEPGLRNLVRTAEHFGYEITIICRGEKFQGWSWRTHQYIDALEKYTSDQDVDQVVIITDGNDVYFVDYATEMERKFRAFNVGVVMGAELAVCNGEYVKSKNRKEAHLQMEKIFGPEYLKNNRYRFPNAGFIVGFRNDVLNLLKSNKDEPDDQSGFFKKMLNDPSFTQFTLDKKQELVANVGRRSPFLMRAPHNGLISSDMAYWKFPKLTNGNTTNRKMMHVDYKTSPCAVHFPGKNWASYDYVARKLRVHPKFEYIPMPAVRQLLDVYQYFDNTTLKRVFFVMIVVAVCLIGVIFAFVNKSKKPVWQEELCELDKTYKYCKP